MLTLVLLSLAVATCRGTVVSTQFHSQDGLEGYSYGHSGGPSSRTESRSADGVVSGSFSYVDGSGIVQTATYTADPTHGFRVHASNLPVPPPHVPAVSHSDLAIPVYRPIGIPVVDTQEVAAAKAAHLAAVEHQKIVIASHHYRKRRDVPSYHHYAYPGFSYHTSTTHIPFYYQPYPLASHYSTHYPYPLASQLTDGVPVPVTDTPEVAAAKSAHLSAVAHAKSVLGVH